MTFGSTGSKSLASIRFRLADVFTSALESNFRFAMFDRFSVEKQMNGYFLGDPL